MRIKDLSERTGASPRMLRHYENAGVLTPRRDPNGYRQYGEADVKTVHDIRCLLACGLSLTEAAALIHIACTAPQSATDADRAEVLAQLDERARQLDAGIERLRTEKASLGKLRNEIATAS
ncbi:DNA-binding transcriptional MerR regulator [Nocardia tenerifensis]|uniref:DNA-binding transcriptional MerR regulator n=1 Tax=Nocardia tenerifensis TaxID=228006 RepID=A0A318JYN8_9NOCA|nr:MerR family transcriptional regulator [Nocardia tenerifensis]PXX60418.1 DNA-binding transcriptional MerR regulator [Nocardia tenerifensis]